MTIHRVRYVEKQILRAADLTGEQTYRMVLRRRHILAAHDWGIVFGLMLDQLDQSDQPEEKGFWLQPGLAVDGYGREISVPKPHRHLLGSQDDGVFDVWLLYAERPLTTPQGSSYPCGPGQHNRGGEGFTVEVEPASPEEVDPWQPTDMIAADRDFAAWENPPDDPARRWPVYLGRVEIDGSSFQVRSVARPYVPLIGERVIAPSGGARMDVGAEQGGGWRFAVTLPDQETGALEDDRLVLDSFGRNTLRGRVTLQRAEEQVDRTKEADLVLPSRDDPSEELSYGFIFGKPVEEPTQATPWRIYHTQVKPPEQPGQPPPPPVDQLRMELFHPEDRGNPSLSELVIGASENIEGADGKTKFVPCLRIGADGSVTVYGDVTVMGSLTQGPIPADPTDPRFVDAVLEGRGRGESATQIDSTFKITITAESDAIVGSPWPYKFEVENEGSDNLASVVVRVDVILPNQGAVSETLPMFARLEAGKSTGLFERQITAAVPGRLLVSVMAVGFGPQMRSMVKQEQKEFRINPAAPIPSGATDTGNTPSESSGGSEQ